MCSRETQADSSNEVDPTIQSEINSSESFTEHVNNSIATQQDIRSRHARFLYEKCLQMSSGGGLAPPAPPRLLRHCCECTVATCYGPPCMYTMQPRTTLCTTRLSDARLTPSGRLVQKQQTLVRGQLHSAISPGLKFEPGC